MSNKVPAPVNIASVVSAPLPELLDAIDGEIFESEISDPEFFGGLVQRRDGHVLLSLPAGRPAFERDCTARFLIAKYLRLDTDGFPASLEATEADTFRTAA